MRSHPSTTTPTLGVLRFTNLVHPSLTITLIFIVCLINAQPQRRTFFKKLQFPCTTVMTSAQHMNPLQGSHKKVLVFFCFMPRSKKKNNFYPKIISHFKWVSNFFFISYLLTLQLLHNLIKIRLCVVRITNIRTTMYVVHSTQCRPVIRNSLIKQSVRHQQPTSTVNVQGETEGKMASGNKDHIDRE